MKNIKLTERQKNIILMIPGRDKNPITISKIAEDLGLSARTVKRDIISVESWFDLNDFKLSKKPGVGLFVDEDDEMISLIRELLEVENIKKLYAKEDRVKFILSKILSSREPIKYYALTNYLNISDKTISQDMGDVERWLSDFDISLIKKPGEGISILGREKDIRSAQIQLIHEGMDDEKRMDLIRDMSINQKAELVRDNDVLSMIDTETINKVKKTLVSILRDLKLRISDNAYIGLLVHISLAIERLKMNTEPINSIDAISNIKDTQEYFFAKSIVEALEVEFGIDIPDSEIYYIAMHIKGAKIVRNNNVNVDFENIFEVLTIVKELIKVIGDFYHLNLEDDERLESDLTNHITPAINRLKLSMKIRNPILEDIKGTYSSLFEYLSEIVPMVIYKYTELDESTIIPEDEIGFITIHFAASAERMMTKNVKIKVMTTCPTGVGTSRLLSSKIESRFPNFDVKGNISLIRLNREILEKEGVDLIVSTVKLDDYIDNNGGINTPWIVVNTFPTEEDYEKIRRFSKEFSRNAIKRNMSKTSDDIELEDFEQNKKESKISNLGDKQSIREFRKLSRDLSYAIDSMKFFEFKCNITEKKLITENKIENSDKYVLISDEEIYYEDISSLCSGVVSNDSIEEEIISRNFRDRLALGSIYFDEFNTHIMHCKSKIKNLKLGFGRNIDDNSETIIIMVLPDSANRHYSDFMGKISSLIVEDDEFINLIRSKDIEQINNKMEEIVDEVLYNYIHL